MTPNVQIAVQLYPDRAADYKWFDVGQIHDDKDFEHKEIAELMSNPMPFDKCAIAGEDSGSVVFGVLVTKGQEGSQYDGALLIETAVMHLKSKEHAHHVGFWIRQADDQDALELSFVDDKHWGQEAVIDLAQTSTIVLGAFLETIHKPDAQYQMYTAMPKGNNPKRIRQGKKPLFDWHTVLIEPPRQKMPDQGGTHASPRLHDVRGHWVKRGDKRYWRRAHQRGDASLGVVFHDYKLKEKQNEMV